MRNAPKILAQKQRNRHNGRLYGQQLVFHEILLSKEKTKAFDIKAVEYWMPVSQYIGGIEHAVGH